MPRQRQCQDLFWGSEPILGVRTYFGGSGPILGVRTYFGGQGLFWASDLFWGSEPIWGASAHLGLRVLCRAARSIRPSTPFSGDQDLFWASRFILGIKTVLARPLAGTRFRQHGAFWERSVYFGRSDAWRSRGVPSPGVSHRREARHCRTSSPFLRHAQGSMRAWPTADPGHDGVWPTAGPGLDGVRPTGHGPRGTARSQNYPKQK